MIIIDGTQYCNWNRRIFEEMRQGGVTAVHATLVYHATARETLSIIGRWQQRFHEHADLIMPISSAETIHTAHQTNKTGIIFGFQNPSPIEDDITLVELYYRLGVRFMQLTYNNQSLLASGCYEQEDSGITRFGKQVIAEMNRVGMIIDMSHSGERSTLEAIELSTQPVVVSHANPHAWHASLRNKSDAVLRALSESGGLLGFSLYPFHLRQHSETTLADFCGMVARTAELMGVEHIAIGSDLCQDQPLSVLHWMRNGRWAKATDFGEGSANNDGWPAQPDWFKTNADFPNLIGGLRDIGFDETEVANIMGGNWLRLCEALWT